MKPIRQQLCAKCLELYRKFENARRNKIRRLKVKQRSEQEKGNIKINK